MPPQQPNQDRQPQGKQQPQRCPACGNEPMKGSKAGEPICKICGSGLSSSPLGKQAMKAAGDQAAAKVKQAMSARQKQQQAAQAQQMAQRRAIAGGGPQGMQPGMGAPRQGQPQINPQVLAALAARLRGGR